MVDGRFCHYELRTKDVASAGAFYSELFGAAFWSEHVTVVPLPEPAAARGAPSHWLGFIDVPNVEDMVLRIVERGGQRLGPTRQDGDGASLAALRDPFGAVVGVSSGMSLARSLPVAWHLLHTTDHQQASAMYAELFGWSATELVDLGPELGCHQMFAWNGSGGLGSVANTALLPHIHTHWQFYFRVTDLDASLARARALGALVLAPVTAPTGARAAACDDPHGAAFGLYQD